MNIGQKLLKLEIIQLNLRKKIGSDLVEEIWNGDNEKEKLGVEYFGVGDLEVSNNDKYLGYSLDTKVQNITQFL
jgi:oligopeptidase B